MVLGPVAVDGGATLTPRDRAMLAALTVQAGDVVAVPALIDVLWGDNPPPSATKVVHGCAMRLRRTLGQLALETVNGGYRLNVPPDEIDARRFERLIRQAQEFRTRGEPDRAAHALTAALGLWRGRAYGDLELWERGRLEAERLEELRLDAQEVYLAAAVEAVWPLDAVSEAQAQVAAAPLRERRWAMLARAQYRLGRQGDALATLRRARRTLVEELGLDPGPELVALEQAILRQDAALVEAGPAVLPSGTCPYVGLVPYGVGDANTFFGRDGDVTACLRRLDEVGVVVLVGPSGSGKSSVLRAGIVAAQQRGPQPVLVTPGAHPMESLAAALRPGASGLLAVDQCEEALTLCSDVDERRRFFDALAEHAEHSPLVIAFRADKLEGLAAHPRFARMVERGLYLLGSMGEAQLREAIEGPARQAGLLLEPGLTDVLVREVEGEPGGLPMLSHALRETWQRREGRTLTLDGYHAVGGIRQAIAQTAEDVYERTPDDERSLFRDLLLRLVARSEEGRPVSTPVVRRLFAGPADRERLLDRLVDARLVTSDERMVGLAHEALAEAWPRLQRWLDDDVEGQRILRHLASAAVTWTDMDGPDSELYRGARLAAALEWRDRTHPDLTPNEAAFLDASSQLESQTLRAAQHEVRSRRRSQRRLRALLAGVCVSLVVVALVTVAAVRQRSRADIEATAAEGRRLAARALLEPSVDVALLYAVAAVRRWDSPETRGNLLTVIERNPRADGVLRTAGGGMLSFAMSPDGRHAVAVDDRDDAMLYDLHERRLISTVASPDLIYMVPAFSPDGRYLAMLRLRGDCDAVDCPVEVHEVTPDGLRLVAGYTGFGHTSSLALSRDGKYLAAAEPLAWGEPHENVALWRITQPDKPTFLTVTDVGADVRTHPMMPARSWLGFSPDGRVLYASGAGTASAFDTATGKVIRTYPGLGAYALSPDGRMLVVDTAQDGIGLFDSRTGALRVKLTAHDAQLTSAAFTADGRRLATTRADGTVQVWDSMTGARLRDLAGHGGSALGAGFSADGAALYTAAADRTVIRWQLDGGSGLASVRVPPTRRPHGWEPVVLVSRDSAIAVLVDATEALVVDTRTGTTRALATPEDLAWAALFPDGSRLAVVTEAGVVTSFDTASGARVASVETAGGNRGAIAVSPDGRTVIVGNESGVVQELDAGTLAPTGRTLQLGRPIDGIRATHGGVIGAVESGARVEDGTDVAFADFDDPNRVQRVHLPLFNARTNFSADGARFAAGDFGGRLAVIDVATGQVSGRVDPAHDSPISWVEFGPDGIVSTDSSGNLVLSDGHTAEPRAVLRQRALNTQIGIGFVPGERTAVIVGGDGSATTYNLDSDAWLAHACRVAGRDLTADEWRDAFGARKFRSTCPQ